MKPSGGISLGHDRAAPDGGLREPPSSHRDGHRAAAAAGSAGAAAARDPAAAARDAGTDRRTAADQSRRGRGRAIRAAPTTEPKTDAPKAEAPAQTPPPAPEPQQPEKPNQDLQPADAARRSRDPAANRTRAAGSESRPLRGPLVGHEGPVRSSQPLSRTVGAEPQGTQPAVRVDARREGGRDRGAADADADERTGELCVTSAAAEF